MLVNEMSRATSAEGSLASDIATEKGRIDAILAGADVVTIPPVVFWSMYKNIMTEKGLELFQKDWEEVLKSKGEK
jgi:transaldolase